MDLSPYYNEAYVRYAGVGDLAELRAKLERESRGLLQLIDENKERFLPSRSWEGLKVAELGGGVGALGWQLARRGAHITLVDFAPQALQVAKRLYQSQGLPLEALCLDLGRPDAQLGEQYDLMIDSHLLHCIALPPQRASYLSFVRDHLSADGILVGETMVHRKKMYIPDGYKFDEDYILWQKFADWMPVRKIEDSLNLEEEFKNAGLKIVYFYYYANYSMAPSSDFWDIPADVLPASVRFAVKRA